MKTQLFMKQVVCKYFDKELNFALGYGFKSVISADHIATIAAKCPSLKKLKLFKVRIENWPPLNHPWALKELTIFDNSSINMDVSICQISLELSTSFSDFILPSFS